MRAKFGIYESRLFIRIVEKCQLLLPQGNYMARAYDTPSGWSFQFSFPLSSLTTSHNYIYVKKACQNLKNMTCSTYDIDRQQWKMAGFIKEARIDEQSGILKVEVADWVCRSILDFRQGWRLYDIEKALAIRNPYALRMYLITCTQSKTLTFSIGYIRGLLLGDNNHAYHNSSDFIKRCLKPAAQELEQLGCNGFTYEAVKATGDKKSRIEKIKIIPQKRENQEKNISETRKEIKQQIPEQLLQYLTLQCGLTSREIGGRNLAKFARFCQQPNWQGKFINIVTRWRKHRYGHGWLINAIDKEGNKSSNNN